MSNTVDLGRFTSIVSEITCNDYLMLFEVGHDDGQPWLRVTDPDGVCNVTGKPMPWAGRKWRLSHHMTTGEVVQTAFLALMTAIEHETRERFLYKGQPVMGPHLDMDKWVDYLSKNNMEKGRD